MLVFEMVSSEEPNWLVLQSIGPRQQKPDGTISSLHYELPAARFSERTLDMKSLKLD
jgi:hypothetical protein